MIKIGMMIADRYEIIEKIGTGGMSDVYRAKCHKLNRFVAVKVLKQEFSENADFVSKFRTEAQAAAGLMHPNIVNVYDVGEEAGFHYIVMELVEGITLKKYIEKKARLSVKEAVSIAIQVAMGIEAAHNNHIIHRDIKPQNIIISKEGKVKVTDFGIAKAATSNTITSNVMGSVHYTSPEQVRGGFSDEKSDIYSLGITLFEMLTGRVPFNGETTVAVAIKHIQEPMMSPRDFVPEIPVSVEQIVLKCTQKRADRRYQNAPELIEDLKKSLISPDENFVKIDDDETYGGTKRITEKELSSIKEQTHRRDSFDAQLKQNTGKMGQAKKQTPEVYEQEQYTDEYQEAEYQEEYDPAYDEQAPYEEEYDPAYEEQPVGEYNEQYDEWLNSDSEVVPERKTKGENSGNKQSKSGKNSQKNGSSGKNSKNKNSSSATKTKNQKSNSQKKSKEEYDDDDYEDPKMELLTNVLVVIAAIIIGCIFLYVITKAIGISLPFGDSSTGADTPDITTESVPNGELGGAEGDGSETADAAITTETASTMVVVPNVIGMSKAEAYVKLVDECGLIWNSELVNSDIVPKDQVIAINPEAGMNIQRGTTITVQVSLGTESRDVEVPKIVGLTEEEAIVTLAEHGLNGVLKEEVYDNNVELGSVCYQSYSAGMTVNTGTDVEYRVSKGPEQVYFNCITSVPAPADFAGGDATVVLVGSDGTQLFATSTDTFPVNINVSNIFAMASGQVTITYYVNKQQEVTDGEGVVTVQNVPTQVTSEPIAVTFTKAE